MADDYKPIEKGKSQLIKLRANLRSFDYSEVGDYDKKGTPHPIADVEAQYDKLDVDEGQLIKRDIGERYTFSQGDNVSIDGGFVRGGAAVKVQRQLEDQKRIAKFLTTPKGALFTIKQAVLQNQNADRETNIYNPLSLNKSLIDTLSTRPQRHINEAKIKDAFSSLGGFFNFLVGNNTLEQGRKNGNSISNNRNVENLKPDVDTFGGKVDINSNDKANITNDNDLVPFSDFSNKPTLFQRHTNHLFKVRDQNADLTDPKTIHATVLEKFRFEDSEIKIKENVMGTRNELQQRNAEFEIFGSGRELIGNATTMKDDSVMNNDYLGEVEREYKANEFFNIKSKGTRKLQVKYGGELTLTNKLDKTTDLPKDFIKFRIRDVVNGRWIIFPAIFTAGITDNSAASYNPINYIGRADAVHIYQNRTRSISFGFRVVALNEEDIPVIWEKMNYLKGLTLPQYKSFFSDTNTSNNTRPVAPIINLTIGDMFVNTPGYFTSVSVNVANSSTWETKDGRQFPHVCDVSVEFTHIGKEVPSMLGKHYDGAERVPTTAEREILNAEAEKRKQDFLAEAKRRREENIDAFVDGFNIATFNVGNFGTEFSNQYPGKKPLLNVVPDRLGTRTQPLSEHTINIGSLNATGASNRQLTRGGEDQAAKSALFVDKVRPLSKFGNFDTELLTPKQQKVKSDVMKATGGTGIL